LDRNKNIILSSPKTYRYVQSHAVGGPRGHVPRAHGLNCLKGAPKIFL